MRIYKVWVYVLFFTYVFVDICSCTYMYRFLMFEKYFHFNFFRKYGIQSNRSVDQTENSMYLCNRLARTAG